MTIAGVSMKVKGYNLKATPVHEPTAKKLFVVYHMGVPEPDPDAWRLSVGGPVKTLLTLTLVKINAFPKAEVHVFHH